MRRKTQEGADRIKATELRATVAAAKAAMDAHTPLCYRCKHAGSDVYGHCDAWWTLARNLHETRRQLKAFEQPPSQGELTLFDVGEL